MKNIEIITSQNVMIEYQLATVGDRILAFFIDAFVIAFGIFMWLSILSRSLSYNDDYFLIVFLQRFAPLLGTFFYFLLMESFTGQTLGKKALSIKVVRLDGQEPMLGDYAIRTVFHLIDTLTSSGLLATVLVAATAKRQRIGDMAANTSVVKLNPANIFRLSDILQIDSLQNYEPVFPQVLQLREDDMLLIKNVLSRYRQYPNEAHNNAVVAAARQLTDILGMKNYPTDSVLFLNTLLKDYIVLTR
jgi:uncharacterized RDD family membrane protein YckC